MTSEKETDFKSAVNGLARAVSSEKLASNAGLLALGSSLVAAALGLPSGPVAAIGAIGAVIASIGYLRSHPREEATKPLIRQVIDQLFASFRRLPNDEYTALMHILTALSTDNTVPKMFLYTQSLTRNAVDTALQRLIQAGIVVEIHNRYSGDFVSFVHLAVQEAVRQELTEQGILPPFPYSSAGA